jgi:hypothetical protein
VPGVLDAITCRALQLSPPGAPRPALTPAGLAAALRSVVRPSYQAFEAQEPETCAPVVALEDMSRRRARHARIRERTTLLRPAM